MRLTLKLEHNGREAKRVVASIERKDIDSAVYSMQDECERPSPGERIRQVYDEACSSDCLGVIPWWDLHKARRAQWEEFARLAKAAFERGEL